MCDTFSNYPEVLTLSSQTTHSVIQAHKSVFARHGVPKVVVSDHGPCYSSREFKDFAFEWNFQHVTSSPRYPQSNGLSKRTVQTVKNMFKKCKESGEDVNMALLVYRSTPMDNGKSPAEMLMRRELVSNLPSSELKDKAKHPDIKLWRNQQKMKQKHFYDNRNHVKALTTLDRGNQVLIQDSNGYWKDHATVVGKVNPRSYIVQGNQGVCYRRNRRHLKKVLFQKETPSSDVYTEFYGNGQNSDDSELIENYESTSNTRIEPKTSSSVQEPAGLCFRTSSGRVVKRPDRLIETV
ncbi:uncharacterized protein K02A2.6-like [Pecten maximus]|uniref:uncharacterized protein K02A2.6-like n=1 Tax=Pecten maximus TaxID=6579 RepID=UPI0014582F54|nr:uncharacterized protein K02A2.6-like [Pecten maximus]